MLFWAVPGWDRIDGLRELWRRNVLSRNGGFIGRSVLGLPIGAIPVEFWIDRLRAVRSRPIPVELRVIGMRRMSCGDVLNRARVGYKRVCKLSGRSISGPRCHDELQHVRCGDFFGRLGLVDECVRKLRSG